MKRKTAKQWPSSEADSTEAQPVLGDEARLGLDAADYVVVRRQVPVTKGKWRMVSKEVEESDSED